MAKNRALSFFAALLLIFSCVFALPACSLPEGKRRYKELEITTAPTKTTYFEGETFDPTGMVVSAVYSDGTKEVIDADDYNYDLKRPLTPEDKYVVILYKDKMTDVKINVVLDLAVSAVIKTAPATMYAVGETADLSGMVLTVTRMSGKQEDVVYNPEDKRFVVDTTPVTEDSTSISFTYDGVSISHNISIALAYTQFGQYLADCVAKEQAPNLTYSKIMGYQDIYSAGGYTYGEVTGTTTDGTYVYAAITGRDAERDTKARIFKINPATGAPLGFSAEYTASNGVDTIIYLKDGNLYTYANENGATVVKTIATTLLTENGGVLATATDVPAFKDGSGNAVTPIDVSYNQTKEKYAVLASGGKVYVYDKQGAYESVISVKSYGVIGSDNLWNTHMSTTGDYIYLSFHNSYLDKHVNNVMATYDWSGTKVCETTFNQSVLASGNYTKLMDSVVVGAETYVFLTNPLSGTSLQVGIYKAYTTDKYTK